MSNNSIVRPGPHRVKRAESAVFADIAELCRSPGYVHALAYICHRDNFVAYDTKMKSSDTAKLFTRGRLIRTEIITLIGLLVQQNVDLTLPAPVVMQSYIDRTDALMDELHAAIGMPMFEN
ncbi:MAG: preprotein translocase, partial [Pseudomonadales bacterium]